MRWYPERSQPARQRPGVILEHGGDLVLPDAGCPQLRKDRLEQEVIDHRGAIWVTSSSGNQSSVAQ